MVSALICYRLLVIQCLSSCTDLETDPMEDFVPIHNTSYLKWCRELLNVQLPLFKSFFSFFFFSFSFIPLKKNHNATANSISIKRTIPIFFSGHAYCLLPIVTSKGTVTGQKHTSALNKYRLVGGGGNPCFWSPNWPFLFLLSKFFYTFFLIPCQQKKKKKEDKKKRGAVEQMTEGTGGKKKKHYLTTVILGAL